MKKILLSLVTILCLGQTVSYAAGADNPLLTMLAMDKFEILNNDEKPRAWEGSFWVGYDIDKVYLYSVGEATVDGLEASQNEVVYSRAILPFTSRFGI